MKLKWGHWEVTIVTSLAKSFISGFCVHFDSMIKKGDLKGSHISGKKLYFRFLCAF